MGFTVKKEKGASRRCPERPLEEHAPLGMRPTKIRKTGKFHFQSFHPFLGTHMAIFGHLIPPPLERNSYVKGELNARK